MKILAIESSCDETCAAITEDGRRVLSNIVASQIDTHRLYGGVVPEIASRAHSEAVCGVTREALSAAGVRLEDIDAIAVTHTPGLIGALLVGVNFAKGLALASGRPLVPVHHIRGHVAANYIAFPELSPPFLCLIVSGGHTVIAMVEDYTVYRRLGGTRDDAAGECFDKVARALGLPYPGGVMLDRLAQSGSAGGFDFPEPEIEGEPLSFSFSGLKTAAINILHSAQQKGQAIKEADFAASLNGAIASYLCKKLMLAAEQTGQTKIAVAGGVSANSALRAALERECGKRRLKLYIPPLSLCGDNAAMIAAQGYYEHRAGALADMSLNACAHSDF